MPRRGITVRALHNTRGERKKKMPAFTLDVMMVDVIDLAPEEKREALATCYERFKGVCSVHCGGLDSLDVETIIMGLEELWEMNIPRTCFEHVRMWADVHEHLRNLPQVRARFHE